MELYDGMPVEGGLSQNGEDGVIAEVFRRIDLATPMTGRRTYLEIGAHAHENNTAALRYRGWRGAQFDATAIPGGRIQPAYVTPDTINHLLPRNRRVDFLSIDVDGQDYWLWVAFNRHPALVCIEYNAIWPWPERRVVPRDDSFHWDGSDYFGASFAELCIHAAHHHYVPLYCERRGVNAFFIAAHHAALFQPIPPPAQLWRPPGYPLYHASERWEVDMRV